jgi:hypothetical protein
VCTKKAVLDVEYRISSYEPYVCNRNVLDVEIGKFSRDFFEKKISAKNFHHMNRMYLYLSVCDVFLFVEQGRVQH